MIKIDDFLVGLKIEVQKISTYLGEIFILQKGQIFKVVLQGINRQENAQKAIKKDGLLENIVYLTVRRIVDDVKDRTFTTRKIDATLEGKIKIRNLLDTSPYLKMVSEDMEKDLGYTISRTFNVGTLSTVQVDLL